VNAIIHHATCVAIGDRAILIEGPPGSGKSSLALALIDRGAVLVGDDGVSLEAREGRLYANPPPNIAGLLEVRNLGLLEFQAVSEVPVALVILLNPDAPRFIDEAEKSERAGILLPLVRLWPSESAPALKAELALKRYGLA
jgi:serine kinase of HPr protein (carbohydrate metabolism regulator)